jgi:hypothetical protein
MLTTPIAQSSVAIADYHFPKMRPAQGSGEDDEIDLFEVKPIVGQVACRCARCGTTTRASVPAAVQGAPFGARIHALAPYLKTTPARLLRHLLRLALGRAVARFARAPWTAHHPLQPLQPLGAARHLAPDV